MRISDWSSDVCSSDLFRSVASKADANTFTLTSPVSKTASGDVIIDLVETATTRLASGTNTIVGVDAGALGKTSQGLTALGWQAGRSNEGSDNTFIGQRSGYNNSTGSSNSALGTHTEA